MKRRLINFTAISVLAILIFSCNNLIEKSELNDDVSSQTEQTNQTDNEIKKGSLSIKLGDSGARTVLAEDIPLVRMKYTLVGEKDSVESTIESGLTYDELTGKKEILLDTGKWDLTLFAGMNVTNYYSATLKNVSIAEGANPISFVLTEILDAPQTEKGSLRVKLNFPSDAEVATVKAGLLDTDWRVANIYEYKMEELVIHADNSVTYEKESVPSGTYVVSFKFYYKDNTEIKPGYSELVQVKDYRTSSAERTLETLEKYHSITWNLDGGVLSGGTLQSSFNEFQIVNLPGKCDIAKADCVFRGWYDNAECSGNLIKVIPTDTKQDITLWAKWDSKGTLFFENGDLSELHDLISEAEEDEITILLRGEISSSTLSTIKAELNANTSKKVSLDMSEATGITSIGESAFRGCTGLTSVVIPDGVTSIGRYAFYGCTGLTSIAIPDGVTSIGESAFSGCSGLTSVVIPDSVTSIGDYAFRGCTGLTSVVIPDGVTSIGRYAFYGCTGLTSIAIPDGVTSIGESAFSGCSGLTSVVIPDSVTSIGWSAFRGCSGLTSIVIPDGVTSIGQAAFSGCSGLTSVVIPDSVTSIGESAFSGCTGLTSIAIPDGVTSIGSSAFNGCTGLTSIVIPDGVTSIGSYAFSGCTGLTSIVIPDGVTSIEQYTFYGCTGLTSIAIPDGVTSIGRSAFSGCTGLTSIVIPDGVTSIGISAFSFCNSLKSVVIPDSVTTIRENAFDRCKNIEEVHIESVIGWLNISEDPMYTEDSYSENPLYSSSKASLYIDGEKVSTLVIPASFTGKIRNNAFYNCKGLTSVEIPDSVTSVGINAFNGCTDLTSVVIGNSVTSIGWRAFYGCTGLTSVVIGNSVTSVGSSAFYGCTGLTSVLIPDSVTSIENAAFEQCKNIEEVHIESVDGWLNIKFASYYSSPLGASSKAKLYIGDTEISGKLIIPDGITSIGGAAFRGCSGLTSVEIPDGVKSIGESAFDGCTGLTSVVIGNSVTSIGDYAFYGCTGLTSVVIGDSVTSIGDYAFYDCTSLTSVTVKAKRPPTLGDFTFPYYEEIYVPKDSVTAYKSAWGDYRSYIEAIPE